MPRPRLKTTTLTVRIEPSTKDALAAAAQAERRSLANMLEVAVLAYCSKAHPAHQVEKSQMNAARPRKRGS